MKKPIFKPTNPNDLESLLCALELECLREKTKTLCAEEKKTLLSLLEEAFRFKKTQAIERLIRSSQMVELKILDHFDWHFNPTIPKEKIMPIDHPDFIEHKKNLILIGNNGVGKTHIVKGLMYNACQRGNRCLFISAFEMLERLEKKRTPLLSAMKRYTHTDLLAIDDLGYVSLSKRQSQLFFQVISERVEVGATMITTNRPPKQWGNLLGDAVLAASVLDRLSERGLFLVLEGKSYRKKND